MMSNDLLFKELPLPPHYDPALVGKVWKVPYEERARAAREWAGRHDLNPAAQDTFRVALLLVDVQNTFCIPDYELFVGGRSGNGAIEDNVRLTQFIYRNLGILTQIIATFDTHQAAQIFHAVFLVDDEGRHPAPYTLISAQDVRSGKWKFNRALADSLGIDPDFGQRHLEHYTGELERRGKYDLTVWPYHAMLGGLGHALVSAVEEAIFFHSLARYSRPVFEIKGANPLTEHYSAIGPEVLSGPDGKAIAEKSRTFFETARNHDALIIAGQAKSHCVAWTIDDLLTDCQAQEPGLLEKIYLLDDCSSPVVVPGVIDYTEQAEAAYRRFREAGMHVVKSTQPMAEWPGVQVKV